MIDRAYDHGLRVKASSVKNLKKDPCCEMHDSYEGIWKAFGTSDRKILKSEWVHPSVKIKMEDCGDYNPANLQDGLNLEA